MRERRRNHGGYGGWYVVGLLLVVAMTVLHILAALNSAGVPDFWRDVYWANAIARGEHFPLGGPPIYSTLELGPWWFYLLAAPLWVTGQIVAASVLIQVLAASKYFLAWRLGTRALDARFGLAFAAAFLFAGWSVIPLFFPTHTALTEPALLLLGGCVWRCWRRFETVDALLFGLSAGLCLHAHPSTALFVVIAGLVVLSRHHRWADLVGLALSVAVAIVLLLPPWLQGLQQTTAATHGLGEYASGNFGVDWWHRVPALAHGLLTGGSWSGLLLMTKWRVDHVVLAYWVYLTCMVIAVAGVLRAPRLAPWVILGGALFLAQVGFLTLIRPITPMWMASTALPPLALALAVGWYAWLSGRIAAQCLGAVTLALFVAISLAPFAFFLRQIDSVRAARDANPFHDVATRTSTFDVIPVQFTTVRELQMLGSALCAGGVLHGGLATSMETVLAMPVRVACVATPELRFGGVEGVGVHVVGFDRSDWSAIGIEPERVIGDMGLSQRVQAIAPASGGSLTELKRLQVNPDASLSPPQAIDLEFDGSGGDVLVISNRMAVVAPLTISQVTANGAPAKLVYEVPGSSFYACAECAAGVAAHWQVGLTGVAENLDVILLKR